MKLFPAEFFDIFGLGTFAFLTILSLWALKTQKSIPKWAVVLILIIGILGLVVDGTIVYQTFLR